MSVRLPVAVGTVLLATLSFTPGSLRAAEDPDKNGVLLWPDGAPGAVGKEELDRPRLAVHLPPADRATGAGMIVCPGGGYSVLAIDHEGLQVAQWLNSFGVAGFVLKYRLKPRYQPDDALADAQRAIRYVRHHAEELGVAADRIGILGFSAGGHLTSAAGTRFDRGNPAAEDPVDRQSCRPDFLVLAYPVISAELRKGGSYASTDELVTADTPPAFLFHTNEDTGVTPEHSVRFFLALKAAGVPAELHVFRHGSHGLGLVPGDPATGAWPHLAANWMRSGGLLTGEPRVAVSGCVTIDSRPLNRGWLTLVPADSDAKPIASAYITHRAEGRYAIDAEHGPCPGPHRVEIRQVATEFLTTPSIDDVRQWNIELPVTVIPGEKENVFDFEVSSK